MPSTGSSAKSRSQASFWESAEVGITDLAIDGSATAVWIRNNNKNAIQVTNIKFDDTNVITADTTLESGEIKKLTSTAITCTSGDAFSYTVTIEYTDLSTAADYSFDGKGNSLEGTCAS